ncbi:MAG TPA: hypothetical protein VGW38_00990 [Chloroflexota bacterium]|nr:hypothetical protein [Chloroflexota bacterium]
MLRLILVFAAALAGSILGVFPVAVLGLVVDEAVVLPLALAAGGLLAGLTAGWTTTAVSHGIRAPLGCVLTVSLLTAVALAILLFIDIAPEVVQLRPPIVAWGAASVLLAAVATGTAWGWRTHQGSTAKDLRLTIAALVGGALAMGLVLVLASAAGLTGA